jgi:GntR family transcriptional regulator
MHTEMDLTLKQTPFTLVRENPTSLYLQISSLLREEISSGLYEPSGKLPSEAELVRRFEVSRITVRLALNQLVEENIVERKQGKGTYVSNKQLRHGLDTLRSFYESLVIQGLKPEMRLLSRQLADIPEAISNVFGAGMNKGLRIERLHLVDGQPIALGTSYLLAEVSAISWESIEQQPSYKAIEAITGLQVTRADLAITAQLADEKYARLLEISIGMPLLVMKRVSYLSNGICCDHSLFHIRPEHYEFVLSSYFKQIGSGQ